jgi:hypothetical protein
LTLGSYPAAMAAILFGSLKGMVKKTSW